MLVRLREMTASAEGEAGNGGGGTVGLFPGPSGTVTMTVRLSSTLHRTHGIVEPGGFRVLVTWPKEQMALTLGGSGVAWVMLMGTFRCGPGRGGNWPGLRLASGFFRTTPR